MYTKILKNQSDMSAFVFWGLTPTKPLDHKIFDKFFKRALVKAGFSEEEAKNYCFHSLRHFFTTNMYGIVSDITLQRQTGHKTHSMLLHYADHQIQSEEERLRLAQKNIFYYLEKIDADAREGHF